MGTVTHRGNLIRSTVKSKGHVETGADPISAAPKSGASRPGNTDESSNPELGDSPSCDGYLDTYDDVDVDSGEVTPKPSTRPCHRPRFHVCGAIGEMDMPPPA